MSYLPIQIHGIFCIDVVSVGGTKFELCDDSPAVKICDVAFKRFEMVFQASSIRRAPGPRCLERNLFLNCKRKGAGLPPRMLRTRSKA